MHEKNEKQLESI